MKKKIETPVKKKAATRKTSVKRLSKSSPARKEEKSRGKESAAKKKAKDAVIPVTAEVVEDVRAGTIPDLLLKLFSKIPGSKEAESDEPLRQAQVIARNASLKAASASGALALPAGPFALATILPDLAAVWMIQGQMVADIAATFGKSAKLTREMMFFCLFRHGAAALVRDLVARTGERLLIKHLPARALREVLKKVGIHVTHKTVTKSISKFVPFVGALAVGGYAYFDTMKVAATAIEAFGGELEIEKRRK